jgi:hypothetical protein
MPTRIRGPIPHISKSTYTDAPRGPPSAAIQHDMAQQPGKANQIRKQGETQAPNPYPNLLRPRPTPAKGCERPGFIEKPHTVRFMPLVDNNRSVPGYRLSELSCLCFLCYRCGACAGRAAASKRARCRRGRAASMRQSSIVDCASDSTQWRVMTVSVSSEEVLWSECFLNIYI